MKDNTNFECYYFPTKFSTLKANYAQSCFLNKRKTTNTEK